MKDSDSGISSSYENATNTISEGKAEITVSSTGKVFYNPVQEFNRDLSVAVLRLLSREYYLSRKTAKRDYGGNFKESFNTEESFSSGTPCENGISVLEALSASGLRSIRYAKEIPGIKQITANDISQFAVKTIQNNIEKNNVQSLVTATNSDASLLMYTKKSEGIQFDVIDLDPYGCPSRFLDAAVQSVADGGCLLVTCTDMAVLAGNTPETCYIKYGSICLKSSACHEMALRIALQCIESHANRYGRYTVPLISLSADFYIRLIVKVFTSPVTCKRTSSKLSHVYQCVSCKSMLLVSLGQVEEREGKPPRYSLPRLPPLTQCEHCQGRFQVGGPIWSGELHSQEFVKRLLEDVGKDESLATKRRIVGILTNISQEIDEPLYYRISSLCSMIHCDPVPLVDFRSALLNSGFKVSLSHSAPNSIKTNAPMRMLWDVIRTWVATHPVSKKRLSDESSVAVKILSTKPQSQVSFEYHPDACLKQNILRYQHNPAPNWGPGLKASTNLKGKKKEKQVKEDENINVS